MSPDLIVTFFLLVGLELVLGIDNVLIVSILSGRLPVGLQEKARRLGLSLAMVMRVLLLLGVSALQKLTNPIVFSFSGRDLILLGGGLFLIYKSVKEIHHVVERGDEAGVIKAKAVNFSSAIVQILLFDLVFSIDSVITAVGLTENLYVIIAAVVASFVLVLALAKPIADFVNQHPALKILALAFLLCIGVTLCMEGFHKEVSKAYIYLPMGFALAVELLQMRYSSRASKAQKR